MSNVVVVGSCNLDFIVEVASLPVPGQTVLGSDVVSRPGGKGANQAVAARRLGANTMFVGAIGHDQFGTTLRTALENEDLDLRQLVVLDHASGVALIVVDEAARNQITVSPGANGRLGVEHLQGLAQSLSGPDSVLLMQLEIPVPTCVAAAGVARDANATVVVNAAPLADPNDPDLQLLLALTDVLIVNEGEALTLAPSPTPPEIDGWLEFAARLSISGPSAAVITLGGSGAVAAEDGKAFYVPPFSVDAIDTTGAGDAFCGAVAAALAEKRSLHDAVRRGCAAGALATTAVGAQAALPNAMDIDGFELRQGGA